MPERQCASAREAVLFEEVRKKLWVKLASPKGEGTWTAEFLPTVVTLRNPRGRVVLMIPAENVARYVRVQRDLFRGWTIEFSVLEGMKVHRFPFTKEDAARVLAIMPQKTRVEIRREVRLHAVVLALFGVFYFILPGELVRWGGGGAPLLGAALLLGAAVGFVLADRRVYVANGCLMLGIGLWQLVAAGAAPQDPGDSLDLSRNLATMVGVVLVCWSVQQFAMLGPNAQIRVARVHRNRQGILRPPKRSPLVRRIGFGALAAGVLLLCYAAFVIGYSPADSPESKSGPWLENAGAKTEVVASPVLGLLSLVSGLVLVSRSRGAYAEAKVACQMLIVVGLVFFWGVASRFAPDQGPEPRVDVLSNGLAMFTNPLVMISFLAALIAFNRWFTRAVDRELGDDAD